MLYHSKNNTCAFVLLYLNNIKFITIKFMIRVLFLFCVSSSEHAYKKNQQRKNTIIKNNPHKYLFTSYLYVDYAKILHKTIIIILSSFTSCIIPYTTTSFNHKRTINISTNHPSLATEVVSKICTLNANKIHSIQLEI